MVNQCVHSQGDPMHFVRTRFIAIASMIMLAACESGTAPSVIAPTEASQDLSRIDGRVSTSVSTSTAEGRLDGRVSLASLAELQAPRLEGKTNLVGTWSKEHTVLTCTVRFRQVTNPNWFPRSGVIVVHYQKRKNEKYVDTGVTDRVELGEKALWAMLRGDGYKLVTRGSASREVMELVYKDGERTAANRTEFTCRG